MDYTSQYIIGAGNNVVSTGYGRYRLVLGPDSNGNYYELIAFGIDEITTPLPLVQLKELDSEVLAFDNKNNKLLKDVRLLSSWAYGADSPPSPTAGVRSRQF